MLDAKVTRKGGGILDLLRSLDRRTRAGELELAHEVERRAKTKAPVDEGRLRGSIETGQDREGAFVTTNVDYGKFQEFGTMSMGRQTDPGPTPPWYQHSGRPGGDPAQPFMRPAFFEVTGKAPEVMRRAISKR